jgi:hypothetical protein
MLLTLAVQANAADWAHYYSDLYHHGRVTTRQIAGAACFFRRADGH